MLITSYNHARYIAQALDAVLEQRGVTFEVLIGDDCSTDGTRSVINEYARRYPDLVTPVFPEHNMGGEGKVLYGELVRHSRGRYLAGLDGDDYWTSPDKLLLQVDHLDRHPECSMVFHNAVRRADGGNVPDTLYTPLSQPLRLETGQLFDYNPVAACAPVFRREAIDPLPPWYFDLPWGDLPLYFLAAQHGELHYLPEVMGVYRLHDGGMYSGITALRRFELDVEFLQGMHEVVPPEDDWRRRRRLAVVLARLAREHLRRGDREAARRRLAESFRTWPPDPRRLGRGHGERFRLALWLSMRLSTPRHSTRWS
ncbi:glycosyltransferase [Geodermatophilus sp. SYSU D00696]